jgi:hypothetical protein
LIQSESVYVPSEIANLYPVVLFVNLDFPQQRLNQYSEDGEQRCCKGYDETVSEIGQIRWAGFQTMAEEDALLFDESESGVCSEYPMPRCC